MVDEGDLAESDDEDWEYYPLPSKGSRHNGSDTRATSQMTIVDRSGVHELNIRWCMCAQATPRDIQLIDRGLYPCSFKRIQTCFTFAVLDEYLLENLECTTPSFSFYQKLRRVTNPTFPHKVPVSLFVTTLSHL